MTKNFWLALPCLFAALLWAATGGSISGTVKDPTGAVIPGAKLTAKNAALGAQYHTTTDNQGAYAFPNLPAGRYDLTIAAPDFKVVTRPGLVIDADSVLQVNSTLEMGERSEEVSVSGAAVQVETANTQLGEAIPGSQMTSLSLNGRSYTDLLPIQPGVVPVTSLQPNSIIMAGVTGPIAPSGELNAGNLSISGQRESANGFIVDGSDVQEHMNGGTAVVPDLDSIAEFRVLTDNFDAQYGNYNGGLINVVTKSGSNALHGNAFEFLRNTALDARNYFVPERAAFRQNQFGGTLGGPIRKQKVFFFGDYQGTRTTEGVETGLIAVPTPEERGGDFSAAAAQLTGAVKGPYWADLLSAKLGYPVSPGEPYSTPGCASSAQCVFPGALIPANAWSAPAQHLLPYIPQSNSGPGLFSTSASDQTVRDDKGSFRLDANSRWGLLSAYYFVDDYRLDNPYPTQQGGASVPGFDALTLGRAQLISLSDTKTLGNDAVNEFHLGFTRNAHQVGLPHGGLGVSLASQGFVTGPGTPGIVVQAPKLEGVENIVFNSFAMGVTVTGVNQTGNTYQLSDGYSRVLGSHTLHVGGQVHFDQVNLQPNATFNGTFSFSGSETGSDFADFLLGVPSNYTQSFGARFYLRNRYAGFYGQDSWRARSNLTVNYGLRWDLIAPWYEKYNQIQTIVPGQQSVVYPGAPAGLVFPGDRGIPRTLSPTRYNNLAPRLGVAWSPAGKRGVLKTVLGDGGQSSLRASYGIFYTAFQGLSAGIMYGVPPYGYNYLSPAPPLFATPFITASSGVDNGQRFPLQPAPLNASAGHPVTSVNWPAYLPVNADPFFFHDNRVPYSENYMLSFQRQLPAGLLFTASYVGNQGHHLLAVQEANPGEPALCLALSDPSQVAPGSPTCGPFSENGVFTTASGQVIRGTRGPLGPNYGSVTAQKTIGNSSYNAFEANLRYSGSRSQFLLGYTYSKSLDLSSNLGEQVNPFDAGLSRALSAFDLRHNFVASYSVDLPLDSLLRPSRLTSGWSISGITRFSTGFPVTLYNNTDSSLLGTFGNGVNNNLLDTPNFTPGALAVNSNPRNGQPAFNAALFSLPALGQLGTARRRFFYGPGIDNFDLTLKKTITLPESRSLELRLEAFNAFNHAQFYGPGAVDGNISNRTFGRIVSAAAPRLVQLALKFTF